VRIVVAVAALLAIMVGATGCDSDDGGRQRDLPASTAGLICQLVEYDTVADGIGVRFDTAGGARKDDTQTCALTQSGAKYPYLTLALSPTTVSDLIFKATMVPAGSADVQELGRIAYQRTLPVADGSGPGVELCWLSWSSRMLVLRFVSTPDTQPDQITQLASRLVALAQRIEDALPGNTKP